MGPAPRDQRIRFLAIVFGAAPFLFALVRVFSSHYDLRMLWMAIASFLGAFVVRLIGEPRSGRPNVVLALAAVTFVVAALLAASMAFLLGATAAPGVLAVAFVFGLSWAASNAFDTLFRPRPT